VALMALISISLLLLDLASNLAIVVLPVPGGPYKSKDGKDWSGRGLPVKAAIGPAGFNTSSCPRTSSNWVGRIRAASGKPTGKLKRSELFTVQG
jgi:hypothetical protein